MCVYIEIYFKELAHKISTFTICAACVEAGGDLLRRQLLELISSGSGIKASFHQSPVLFSY